jgi:hypothetical protein
MNRDPGQKSLLQVDEKLCLQAAQKDSEARRAKNRRAEAYFGSTSDCVKTESGFDVLMV